MITKEKGMKISKTYLALQVLNQNPLHEEEGAWTQAPIEVSRRGVGEVFSLDILSHRMSVMAMFRQLVQLPSLA